MHGCIKTSISAQKSDKCHSTFARHRLLLRNISTGLFLFHLNPVVKSGSKIRSLCFSLGSARSVQLNGRPGKSNPPKVPKLLRVPLCVWLDYNYVDFFRAPVVQYYNRDSFQFGGGVHGIGSCSRQSMYFISREWYSQAQHSTFV